MSGEINRCAKAISSKQIQIIRQRTQCNAGCSRVARKSTNSSKDKQHTPKHITKLSRRRIAYVYSTIICYNSVDRKTQIDCKRLQHTYELVKSSQTNDKLHEFDIFYKIIGKVVHHNQLRTDNKIKRNLLEK